MSDIILRIRQHRNRLGLSQEELAKRIGVSRQALISIEQGVSRPSLPVVLAIMRALDLPFNELFAGNGIRLKAAITEQLIVNEKLTPERQYYQTFNFNLSETPERYVIEAELAGIKQEDVTIDLGFSHAAIYAVRHKTDNGNALIQLIQTGQLLRILALPEPIDPEKAEATFRDGMLRLTLPKNSTLKRTIKFKKTNNSSDEKDNENATSNSSPEYT